MKITQKALFLCNSTTRNKLTAQIFRILPSSVFPFTFFQHFRHLNLKLSGRTCKIQSSYTTLGSIITLPEGRGFIRCFPNPVGWAFLTKFYLTPLEFAALEEHFTKCFSSKWQRWKHFFPANQVVIPPIRSTFLLATMTLAKAPMGMCDGLELTKHTRYLIL